ncbi:group III truncated hemoglobin [Psychroflexus sp. CAK8W]|uniref:Group III truncated hemoglobin n=1 Tax=Psychroflexus longus TaxID=2873596 RepID=A0ABS7XKL6_9FLAO|nr:group III truncated hemoglobin [Psychroflexus longus]MBZ9778939.1 group III truncated hemoglobin [Psychroflexus longus]
MVKDISTREDISLLVTRFYSKVRANEEIGYFFNEMIKDWGEHLEKLTDFWESNLFFKSKYKGNPKLAHERVDTHFDGSIEQKHFGIWLNLWFETIDDNFEGEKADRAKNNARNMASHLFITMYMDRNICASD